jgi:hypothetical protein
MSTPPSRPPRRPWALTLIAAIGGALSFNAIRVMAAPHAGTVGGIATALLFDAAMWLASRWYIDTVKTGQPLRAAQWLSMTLIGATLAVNVAGAHSVADGIVHGIGPALFAAFTWIEATIELRAYRQQSGQRERVPAGEKLVHPRRAARVWLMMVATDTRSYTAARAICQNREARRRTWAAQHRPGWLAWLLRRARPGWRGKVDPVEYVAYRWGAFDTHAHVIGAIRAAVENITGSDPPALPGSVPGTFSGTVPGGVPGDAPGRVPEAVTGTARQRSATPAGNGRAGGAGTAGTRGAGLPAGIDSGRDLSPEQVAELIRAGRAGVPDPGVRRVMRTFAVRYDTAVKALELAREPVTQLHAVNDAAQQ